MATYSNIGIKLITTGDESGTWGTSTNTNFSDVLDEAIAGAVTYNISSDADFTLTVSDGTSSDARHAVIKFTSTTLSATRTCTFAPNDLQKTWVVINATTGGQSLTFKQGSAGATVTVPNGESAIIYSDGGGASAGAITRVLDSFTNTKITTGTLNATTLDLTNLEVTNIKAKDGTAALTIADSTGKVTVSSELSVDNLNLSGNAITSTDSNGNIDITPNGTGEVNITKVDIDGGAIDNVTIGGSTSAAGTFTTLTATTGNITTVNATTVDATNVEVTNVKAKDGTAAASIADSTGIVSLSANPILSGGTANGVLYLNGSKVATSGSALTFNGTSLGIGTSSPNALLEASTADSTVYSTSSGQGGSGGLLVTNQLNNNNNIAQITFRQRNVSTYDTSIGASGGSASFLFFKNGGAEQMRLTSTGLGIGTTSPAVKLDVVGAVSATGNITSGGILQALGTVQSSSGADLSLNANGANRDVFLKVNGTTLMTVQGSTTNVGIGTTSPAGKLDVLGTAFFGADSNASVYLLSSSTEARIGAGGRSSVSNVPLTFYVADGGANYERMRLDTSGNLGLGVTPSAWTAGGKNIEVGSAGNIIQGQATQIAVIQNATFNSGWKYSANGFASFYNQSSGQHLWYNAPSGTAGNAITFTQAMTLDASGNLGVGTTSPSYKLQVEAASASSDIVGYFRQSTNPVAYIKSGSGYAAFGQGATNGETRIMSDGGGTAFVSFYTGSGTERARITSDGILGVGVTAPTGALSDAAGAQLGPAGWIIANRAANPALFVNRKTDDGDLVQFYQADTQEGSISVSGNTVSYNAFAGSHWSQLQDGSKPDILRGTVMESINELCVWPGEQNERLPKSKVSDTAGSKKVYGVFMAWDNDWTETNDMYVTAVGAFICRVNGSVTVQEGDLLESNGDGTARVQADDIIRSSTIGKVTSTVKTHQYDDGSYCVPTVLYCG